MKQNLKWMMLTGMVLFWGGELAGAYSVEHVPEGFLFQVHRCAGKVGPENTLESCTFAWDLGGIPEIDVRTTRDEVVVAFHDKDMKRVVDGLAEEEQGRGIETFVYRDLKELDVGVWRGEYFRGQRIPMVASIFSAMQGRPDRRLYLDIKDVPLVRLARMVYDFGVEKQVILASTKYELIREWKELVPESETLHWMGGSEESLRQRIAALRKADYAGITQLQIHAHVSDLDTVVTVDPSEAFFREVGRDLQERGILFQSLPWGTADPRAYWKLMDLGVESFATDYPQQTLQAVSDYYGKLSK